MTNHSEFVFAFAEINNHPVTQTALDSRCDGRAVDGLPTRRAVPFTLHASAKACVGGFLPMIQLRGERGRMLGAKCPNESAKESKLCGSAFIATMLAHSVAIKLADEMPQTFKLPAAK